MFQLNEFKLIENFHYLQQFLVQGYLEYIELLFSEITSIQCYQQQIS